MNRTLLSGWGMAAAVAAVVIGFFAYRTLFPNSLLQPTTAPVITKTTPTTQPVPVEATPQPFVVQTRYGERRRVTLPDQSVAVLNANSSLTMTERTNGIRQVQLDGEAFFIVSKQKRADGGPVKFVVQARNVTVEVLGTQFNVSTCNRLVRLVLNEGKIRLKVDDARSPRTLDLLPGGLVEVTEQQQIALHSRINPEPITAWTTDELVFDDTPLSDIARIMENNYGYKVEFADPALASRRLTATLPDSNLNGLLLALEKAFNLSVTRQEKLICLAITPTSKVPWKSLHVNPDVLPPAPRSGCWCCIGSRCPARRRWCWPTVASGRPIPPGSDRWPTTVTASTRTGTASGAMGMAYFRP
ncbi:hypothetical protein GCM10023187_56420 [Nibrella viscosa]|uniref:FecR family protein n=1 Tax=Nibrella viscosa TaxID=1084524 RepID=A0ABP8L3B2_9BACT